MAVKTSVQDQDDRSPMSAQTGWQASTLSLTRGSFATQCLQSFVSKMGIDIQVEYWEYSGAQGLTKVDEWTITAKNASLEQTLKSNNFLAKKFRELSKDFTVRCYAGDIEGKEIDVSQKPDEIEYVIDAVRSSCKPVIIVCKEPMHNEKRSSEDDDADEQEMVGYTGRTASGMVKQMLNLRSRSNSTVSGMDEDHSPMMMNGSLTPVLGTPVHSIKSTLKQSRSLTRINKLRVHSELYPHSDEQLVMSNEHVLGSEGEEVGSDTESTCSSHTTSSVASGSSETHEESTSPNSTKSVHQETIYREPKIHPLPYDDKDKYRTLQLQPRRGKDRFSKRKWQFGRRKSRPETTLDISAPSPPGPVSVGESSSCKISRQRPSAMRGKRRSKELVQATIPECSYSFEITSVNVIFRGGSKMEVSCREFNTIMELKGAIAKQLNEANPDRYTPWKHSDLVLSYKSSEGKPYELFSDWQFIFSTALYQIWVKENETETPIHVEVMCRGKEEDLRVIHRISNLVGVLLDEQVKSLTGVDVGSLRKVSSSDRKEAQWARRTLHDYVTSVTKSRNAEEYSLSMELVTASTSTILALKIPIDSKIQIVFHYKQCFSLVKKIKVQRIADSVLREVFPCIVACGLVENRIEAYTMQISGEKSFVAGNYELIAFKDIRRCITKAEPVHLSITDKPRPEADHPSHLNWLSIDPLSGVPPLHTDITRTIRRDSEIQALSMWDREEEFTLSIMEATNLPLVQSRVLQAVVEATLYHGEKQLCPTVTTTAKVINLSVKWGETLVFKIAKKNIPKSAKILIQISEPYQRRESASVRRNSKFIYWGLCTVFDHERMMYNGEKIMSLWKGKKDEKKDERKDQLFDNFHELNPSGPALNNSCAKAVKLKIKFEEFGYPMYFPSCLPESWSMLQSHQEDGTAVRKQYQKLVEFIKNGKLHSALPTYVLRANWGKLSESLEVYSMLAQIEDTEGFPEEIALKLLDCDFPDENIRGYATKVLRQLPDERLEDFLLQLTQALKFELHHDSDLARFLLGRALRNKRIGHFFFWYLKCEMYNLQYMTRFGVILEAYLKGCGDAMLKQFEHQVEMQTTLEEIASVLKQKCSDDHTKMQAMLPEMLESYGVPHFEVTPVYNPRISLGSLRPTKCRIMASKKKPQWLEMYNIDPTALTQTPTRLIVKLGDDLRQDMITLRMFSLFEKLWEEDGLDLALIPYGCIATGPDSGFIEVVKNARTIAEVSGVNNQTKLLDWIKSHQKNEFDETDPDQVKEAVRTFVHSCAGYSVATYVLGIGDRHNDNIMLTRKGNLFHIDFGHFLGNIKYIMGFKREWAPFVLTPDFVYVMGGEESATFETYKNLCCRAFLTLRRHAELIINLFSLMRCTGIPELTCVEDTDYIRNALVLEKSEHDAEQSFRKVIKKCLDLKWTVQVMWKFHLLRKKSN